MSEQGPKPNKTGEPGSKASRSYPEILQLNQELIKNLQGLNEEDEARKKDLHDLKVAYDHAQAEIARLAWRRFGKGRHPAGLNYGDCFAYALAKSRRLPLLFQGDDFSQTDITGVPLQTPPETGTS